MYNALSSWRQKKMMIKVRDSLIILQNEEIVWLHNLIIYNINVIINLINWYWNKKDKIKRL